MDEPNQIVPGNGPAPEAYDPSRDPKQKENSGDPGWEYGYWHETDRRDRIRCKFCVKYVHGGIARFKHHLPGACTKGKKEFYKMHGGDRLFQRRCWNLLGPTRRSIM
jgi:hypothetical protein